MPSSFDAGESIDFFGCTFGNGGIGIKNSGGVALKLYGGAIDYCRQFFVGGGQVTLFGTHLEMAQPSTPEQYPIEVTDGDFKMKGGTLLVTPSGANDFMFYRASRFSRIHLQGVDGYGWPAAKGQLMGGKRRLLIDRVLWGANHQIVSTIKRDPLHSVFGAGGRSEGPDLAIGCAVTCPNGTNQGPHKTHFIGGGTEFYANLSLSREQAHSGTQSLKFTKHKWGGGTGTSLFLFAPIERRRMISCEFWYMCPKVPGAHGSGTFWIDLSFAQITGFDGERVPIIAQTAGCQEAAVHLDYEHGIPDWTHMQLGSTYADVTAATDGCGPDWTTHMLIAINLISMPAAFVMHIDDLYGFVF